MTPEKIEALQICLETRVPVILWGEPGIGKTACVNAIFKARKEILETVIVSIREPSDLGGLPINTPEGVVLSPPAWARRLKEAGKGGVFFDEINGGTPALQNGALRVIQNGIVGDLELPASICRAAAANPPHVSAGGYELTPPLANRFTHISWEVDVARARLGMLQGWPAPPIFHLPNDWTKNLPRTRAMIAAFWRVKPSLAQKLPKEASQAGLAWPSLRSWDATACLLAGCMSAGMDLYGDVASILVQGTVGEGAAKEFLKWSKDEDLPDPELLLADPEKCTLPKDGVKILSVMESIVAAALSDSDGQKKRTEKELTDRWLRAWKVAARFGKAEPDLMIPGIRLLAENTPEKSNPPPEVMQFKDIIVRSGIDFRPKQRR